MMRKSRADLELDNEMASGCLSMIADDLAAFGVHGIRGIPPMMYNDAIAAMVWRLAGRAGLRSVEEIRDAVAGAEVVPAELQISEAARDLREMSELLSRWRLWSAELEDDVKLDDLKNETDDLLGRWWPDA